MSRTIENSTTITATPEAVWSVLVDFPGRPEWDPYYRDIRGEPVDGARLEVRASLGEGQRLVTTHPQITLVDPHRRLVWVNRFTLPGLLDSRQEFRLASPQPGSTELHQTERFTGVLTPLVGRTLDAVDARLREWVLAVKQRVEGEQGPAEARSIQDDATTTTTRGTT